MAGYVITIARGFGSGGRTIGRRLAEMLDINYYDNDLIKLASEESGINLELFGKADEKVKANLFRRYNRSYGEYILPPGSSEFVSDENLFNYQAKIIRDLADKQNCIIIGRCADFILRDRPNTVRIFIYAGKETCIKNVVELYGVLPEDAEKQIDKIDKIRATYYKYYTGNDWNNPANYDLCINTDTLGFDRSVGLITDYMRVREIPLK